VVFLLIRIRSLAAPALPGSLLLQSTNDPREVFSGSSSAFLFWGGGSAGKPRPDAVDGGNYLLLFRAPLLPLILLALPVFLALISLVFFTHLKVKAWFFASWLPSSSRIPRKARRSVSCCRPLSLPWLLQRRFFFLELPPPLVLSSKVCRFHFLPRFLVAAFSPSFGCSAPSLRHVHAF
jgi:hypothetical protein